MKSLIVLIVAFSAAAASNTTFKFAHELTGFRALLAVWSPNDSLAVYDTMGKVVDSLSEGYIFEDDGMEKLHAKLLGYEDAFSNNTVLNEKYAEYKEDLDLRWANLNQQGREFITKHGKALTDGCDKDFGAKLKAAGEEYMALPKDTTDSLKTNFPAVFGTVEKIAQAFLNHALMALFGGSA